MKIAICAANRVGLELAKFVCKSKYPVELAVTWKDDNKENQIFEVFEKSKIECIRRSSLNLDSLSETIKERNIDIVFLLWWPEIVKNKALRSTSRGFVNLHPSFLPYNRGKHPYYWSIVENTQAGVSIHFINDKIDEGDLISQKKIETDITTTGESLYENSIQEIINLFKETYPKIMEDNFNTSPVQPEYGTFHLSKELKSHSEIHLENLYTGRTLIDIMRARSFPGRRSSFFYLDGKRYNVNIQITEDT